MALLGGFGYFVLDDGRLSGVVLEEMLKGSLYSEKTRALHIRSCEDISRLIADNNSENYLLSQIFGCL